MKLEKCDGRRAWFLDALYYPGGDEAKDQRHGADDGSIRIRADFSHPSNKAILPFENVVALNKFKSKFF